MQKIDGWLKAIRVSALRRSRSGNPMVQLANMIARNMGPQKVYTWYLESYGFQYRLTKNLPKGLTADDEGEWVELWADVAWWENGLGASCRLASTQKPKNLDAVTTLRKRVLELEAEILRLKSGAANADT